MMFLIFAFMTAFFESLKDLFGKLGLGSINEFFVSWALMAFALPFLLPLLFFIEIPELNGTFYATLVIAGIINAVSIILYMKAIKASDLSVTIPMITFTPLFLLFTSPVMLGEYPTFLGMGGVVLIVFGSYMLNIKQMGQGFLSPFKALVVDRGPRIMLFVAFIWSFTANFDKIGIQNSSPVFWAIAMTSFVAAALLPPMLIYSKRSGQFSRNFKTMIPLGFFNALALVSQMAALNLAFVAYVISIKRGSAILSVFWGHFFLHEKGIRERLIGVIIMVAGVMLITLA